MFYLTILIIGGVMKKLLYIFPLLLLVLCVSVVRADTVFFSDGGEVGTEIGNNWTGGTFYTATNVFDGSFSIRMGGDGSPTSPSNNVMNNSFNCADNVSVVYYVYISATSSPASSFFVDGISNIVNPNYCTAGVCVGTYDSLGATWTILADSVTNDTLIPFTVGQHKVEIKKFSNDYEVYIDDVLVQTGTSSNLGCTFFGSSFNGIGDTIDNLTASVIGLAVPCVENWTCGSYGSCLVGNVSSCLGIVDLNNCGTNLNSSPLSSYDNLACIYHNLSVVSPENMTSNDVPYPYVVYSGSGGADPYDDWNSFDNESTGGWASDIGTSWIVIDLGDNNSKNYVINQMDYYCQYVNCPESFTIEATNDNASTWTSMKNVTGAINPIGSQWSVNYTFTNNVSYRYWKMDILSTVSAYTNTNVGNIRYYGYSVNNLSVGCVENWTCSSFGICASNNVSSCLSVNDTALCGNMFVGNLSSYNNSSCGYVAPVVPVNNNTWLGTWGWLFALVYILSALTRFYFITEGGSQLDSKRVLVEGVLILMIGILLFGAIL